MIFSWHGQPTCYRRNRPRNLESIKECQIKTETSATLFNSVGLLFLTALGSWAVFKNNKEPYHQAKKIIWFAAVLFIGLSILLQCFASHHEWEYKNDLVLRYQDRYEEKMIAQRVEAATAISDYLRDGKWDAVSAEDLDSLEDVLAFYDELGFYWKNHEISTDVLYEHFYNDMRTYCQVGVEYIHANQKTDSSADWEYVEPLFNGLTRMESKQTGKDIAKCVWDVKTLQENLKSEMRLQR